MSSVVVMVDLYAPTLRLARGFLDAGHEVIRVQSTPQVPPAYGGFDEPGFAPPIIHEGDMFDGPGFERTVAAVAEHRPVAVITGGETGVELADALAERLGLPGNGTALSSVRRDKFGMIDRLSACGLHTADQICVPDAAAAAEWHRARGGRVVVKPTRSAANDGVHFCDTPEQTLDAMDRVAASDNIFGIRNEGVVVQEFLVGGEYVVNTVSCAGRHRVTDMWKYTKISANGVTDRVAAATSIAVDDPIGELLADYGTSVLDALGISYGPAHLEVMMTADGPALVEIGARLCGADTAYFAHLAVGESQIEWTVRAFLEPEEFRENHLRPRRQHAHTAMAFLTSPVAGTLRGYPKLDEVQRLPSYHNHQAIIQPGQSIPVTISDVTEPMMIGLSHPVRDILDRDLATVMYLDGDGFYDVEHVEGGATTGAAS
ncbi:ATP-grasp domain-containing protein [Gordonia sp. NPDC058843]|uniref:ATP-grasp domain-containing protein n=1 Tax=Gordonia sp. NPDC058843 TaxID=3346648 RepID=UPI0036C4D63B